MSDDPPADVYHRPPVVDPSPAVTPWQRTDPRMLLITIARALGSVVVPVVLLLSGIGRGDDGPGPVVAVVGGALAVLFGVLSWATTRYRLDGTHLQVRTGVLSRRLRTVPVERVRSVDLEASLLHRVLGLAKLTVGTGSDSERITLDSLGRAASAALREDLLRAGRADGPATGTAPGLPDPDDGTADRPDGPAPDGGAPQPSAGSAVPAAPQGEVLAVLQPSWVRFALAGRGGLGLLLGLAGAAWFLVGEVAGGADVARDLGARLTSLPAAVVVAGGVAGVVVAAAVLSALAYAQTWWGMRLVQERGGTLHLSRGLTTTVSTTLEGARIRGVELSEPAVLRALRGARLRALTTGVGSSGASDVLPACPRHVALRVGRQVLDAAAPDPAVPDPLHLDTRRHGARALRRLHVGAQVDVVTAVAVGAAVIAWRDWPWWPLAAAVPWAVLSAALATATYRTLGHALTERHLVVTTGTLRRRRVVLDRRGVIGWTLSQSVLQRRAGLVTLTATTAAGRERVDIPDVPEIWAAGLVAEVTPDVVIASRAPATATASGC